MSRTITEVVHGLEALRTGMRCCSACLAQGQDISARNFPRGLHFEPRRGVRPAMVVGLNPGTPDEGEARCHFGTLASASTPEQRLEADEDSWRAVRETHPYYVGARTLLETAGVDGPIWWTEAVKCQFPLGASPDERRATLPMALERCRPSLAQELGCLDQDPSVPEWR